MWCERCAGRKEHTAWVRVRPFTRACQPPSHPPPDSLTYLRRPPWLRRRRGGRAQNRGGGWRGASSGGGRASWRWRSSARRPGPRCCCLNKRRGGGEGARWGCPNRQQQAVQRITAWIPMQPTALRAPADGHDPMTDTRRGPAPDMALPPFYAPMSDLERRGQGGCSLSGCPLPGQGAGRTAGGSAGVCEGCVRGGDTQQVVAPKGTQCCDLAQHPAWERLMLRGG